ncbi:MAG TPA: UDP-glucose/GDP-mannose dehydrogenase family protein [Candidatus Saccharimonadales bacterium]|nr:UDP-glucose/GDP-mannose dehydrogenase family protein [Candidatus Saccharimonadales bacterium]
MKVTVVGTGYVGLVTGTCFAEVGNDVTCIDIDAAKVERMRRGEVPIYEPGLAEMMQRNLGDGRLHFTTDLAEGVASAEAIFLALPTPPNEDGSADLSYVLGVADQLGPLLKDYVVILNKSTVPVGTAEKVYAAIAKNTKSKFDVASNPEFLREGCAVKDFMEPDRVVVGVSSDAARELLERLYEPFTRQGAPLLIMDERSAEITKYAANSFLATKISFMNEIANLCNLLGANVDSVRIGIGSDDRIGSRFLFPGIGYGGSCFPKDVQALQQTSKETGYDFRIIDALIDVNERQKHILTERLKNHYKGQLSGKHFALWGLAYKPDTDDIREAPSLYLIEDLLAAGATVTAYDPEAMDNVRRRFEGKAGLEFVDNEYDALEGADALLIATEWSLFREPDFDKIKSLLKAPAIFDGRNIYELKDMESHGFHYESIGRSTVTPKN